MGVKMNIEIKKLSPELAEDYASFFDTTYHWGNKDTKCYCITWCNDDVYHNGGSHWYASSDERRLNALQRVQNGSIKGYLAYCDDKIVGWCNANIKADCTACVDYMRSEGGIPLDEYREGEKIKLIFCFMIAPEMQRKGIASKLLSYICKDSADEGFDYIEAFPNRVFEDATIDYSGPIDMFLNNGFYVCAEQGSKIVVRKALA